MIGVLGPPIVVTPGGTRSVGGLPGKLLVALAAADAPVDVDRMIEILWADEPPETARAALHVHLGSVRRAFAGWDEQPVERTEVGYRLCPGAWRLDVDLAAEHASRAADLVEGDPERALAATRAALALWRGPAYSVGGEVVAPLAAQRAASLHLEVEELEVAALLATGRSGEAERVALRLVDEEPYRELRWGQLLRARYQAGQVREALATYQDARRVLVEDLGVEPGPLLRDLERAVLTHDEALLGNRRAPPEPAELPGPARGVVYGRERELDRCGAALAEGRPVVIYGAPGVGKTTLANELAHQHEPGSVLWVDLRNHASASHVLAELTGEPHAPGAAWSRSRAVSLIVLDNAEDAADVAVDLLHRLSRMAPVVGLIITSRTRIPVDAVFVPLAPLAVPDDGASVGEIERSPAVLLLRAALADAAPEVELGTDHAVALCRKAGGVPLALRLTAVAARAVSITELATTADQPIRSEVLPAVESTVELVDPVSRAAFLRLGIVRQDFDLDLAAAVADLEPEQARAVLTTLADHGLIQISPGAAAPFSLLEPVRDAAEQLLGRSGQTAAAWDGLVGWSLQHAHHLRRMTFEHGQAMGGLDVARELPHFRFVMDRLVEDGDHERALRLAQLLDAPLYLSGWWPDRERLLDQALSVPGPASKGRALVLTCRASSGTFSSFDPQRLAAALDMAEGVGADGLAAYVRHLRGIHRWWMGDLEGALADHEQAATLFEARGDARAVEVRKYQALSLVQRGDVERGLALLRHAADAYRDRGRRVLFGHTLSFLGHCHRFLGDDDAALADWQESLELLTLFRNTGTAVHVELGLAELAVERGDAGAGARHAGAALGRIASSGNTQYEAWGWTVAMRAAAATGDLERTLGCARSGIAALDHVIPGEAGRLAGELAVVAADQKRWRHAARLLGCAAALDSRRELPFAAPSEVARWAAAEDGARAAIGSRAELHMADGRRCTVREAAGSFILVP